MQILRTTLQRAALPGVVAALALALPALAQEPAAHGHHHMAMPSSGVRAELIQDIDVLEEKYLGLADAMSGKYAWRPGDGVRSVSEVFMHVAGANYYLPTLAGIAPPEGMEVDDLRAAFARMQELEKVTDEAEVKESLRHGFMHARHAIAMTPDDRLEDGIDMFGRSTTKRAALILLVTHMHEHLGQSVAYARTNGVVPPWSAGGGI